MARKRVHGPAIALNGEELTVTAADAAGNTSIPAGVVAPDHG